MNIDYVRQTFHRSKTGGEPLYLQLARYFRRLLDTGVLQPGEQMPPEEELFRALNISRTTIRQAMNLLVAEGDLVRYRARGTFVCEKKLTRKLNHLYNFSSDMADVGMTPSSIVLKSEIVSASDTYIANRLELPRICQDVFNLRRVRCANGTPVLIEDTYIPCYLCPEIEKYDFNTDSLYDVLRRVYNFQPASASETLQAIVIPKNEQKILKCPAKTVGYRIIRIGRTDSNRIYEFTTSITRGDICLYQFELNDTSAANSKSSIVVQNGI